VSTQSPWRAADDPFQRAFLAHVAPSLNVHAVHSKALRTKGLDAVFDAAMSFQLAELREAPAVSVCFDMWTTASKKRAVLGQLMSFHDDKFEFRTALVAASSVDTTHTAMNIAVLIARAVDKHTSAHQQLYCTMSDTASNVLAAGRHVVSCVDQLAKEEMTPLISVDDDADADALRAMDREAAAAARARSSTTRRSVSCRCSSRRRRRSSPP
jgi:hypothetical protein